MYEEGSGVRRDIMIVKHSLIPTHTPPSPPNLYRPCILDQGSSIPLPPPQSLHWLPENCILRLLLNCIVCCRRDVGKRLLVYSIFVLSYLHTATPITYMYTPGPTTMPTSSFVWGKIILVFFCCITVHCKGGCWCCKQISDQQPLLCQRQGAGEAWAPLLERGLTQLSPSKNG